MQRLKLGRDTAPDDDDEDRADQYCQHVGELAMMIMTLSSTSELR